MAAVIVQAIRSDWDAIAQLNVEAYAEYGAQLAPAAWDGMRANLVVIGQVAQQASFSVARVDQALAGSVAYCAPGKANPDIFPPDWASILLLAVLPRYRGQGIATILVQTCIDQARRDHAAVVGLYTSELMTTARRLYERLGFQQDGEIPRRHGLRYWRFRLPLAPDSGACPTP